VAVAQPYWPALPDQHDGEQIVIVTDPNMLLRNIRSAIALNHPNMVMVMFAALDDHITTTGQLPTDWEDVVQ
jgi:hypothetical protein